MEASDGTEVVACTDATEWESWLAEHHDRSRDVWLLIAKKGSSKVSVTIDDALDVALCYGWIDSQRKGHDADHYLQRYSPRRPGSPWSKRNVERAEALIEARRMRTAGLAEVASARADGRWAAAYPSQRDAGPPSDLAAALERNERARTTFWQLDRSGRYAVISPLLRATTPTTRKDRLRRVIVALEFEARVQEAPPAPQRRKHHSRDAV